MLEGVDAVMIPKAGRRAFYAVAKGRQTGVFNSWSECERVVKHSSFAVADVVGCSASPPLRLANHSLLAC